ncbi:hypothetical protein D9615_004895 [Tricholomella constricta]|uniref:Uncharacterized protein n=1 Tax=Tricholomella constricta TaxID=117010 RepID=A0A8H5HGL6_9AGAR|nr:hypothetical protein D9615_004895 [Tricholomella constricta]
MIGLATAWEGLFVYDAILFGLTVAKTCRTRRLHGNVPILALVFRDVSVITLANATNIVTYWLINGDDLEVYA